MVMRSAMACASLSCGYDRHDEPWFRRRQQHSQNRAGSAWGLAEEAPWQAGRAFRGRNGQPVPHVMLRRLTSRRGMLAGCSLIP